MADEQNSTLSHPLFPVDEDTDDDEIKPISWISVSRLENGRSVVAPRQRTAQELQSLDQLHAEFGGGSYVLRAFHAGRIVTQRKYDLPGPSKPLYEVKLEEKPVSQPAQSTAPANPMMGMMQGGEQGMWGLIMMMMQNMMQAQQQAAAQQMQMFMAIMQGNQQATADEKAAARAELQANIERERIASERTMALMREMMSNRGSGGSEDFTRGVEFMRSFATTQIENAKLAAKGEDSGGLESLLETLGQAFQVAQATGILKGPLPEGAPTVEVPAT